MRETGGTRARVATLRCTQTVLFLLAWRQWPWTLRHAALSENIRLGVCVLDRRDAGRSCFRRDVSRLRRRPRVIGAQVVLAARASIRSNRRVCAGMVRIRTLGRVPSVLSLTRRLTDSPTTIFIIVALSIRIAGVDDPIHAFIAFVSEIIVHAEARAAARTATLTLVVSRERIATCEPAATFVARVRTLSSVQFRMTFQIMQTTETRLASGTFVRLLLTVGQ
jgi:hypothetical protein